MKRILITGGAGFVGHHVIEGVLRNTNWKIIVLDGLSYAGSLNRIVDIGCWEKEKHRVKFVYHNLRSPITSELHRDIGELDYVWHLAANSHVDRSLIDARPFAESQVVGTTNLLEYLREYQRGYLLRYIGLNTDECFGPAPTGVFFKETDKFYPSNPYSAAKVGQWAMEYAFAHSYRMPISTVHSMNVIGERQNGEKFLPKAVLASLTGDKITLHGSLQKPSSRCWIHAREVCNALLFLTEHAQNEQSYNVIGEERTVYEIVKEVSRIVGNEPQIEWLDFHSTRPGHDLRYALDGSKLKGMGFNYSFPLSESIEHMVKWMMKPENKKWLIP
jgi:dTDP-glucose 4,6-dehydratase